MRVPFGVQNPSCERFCFSSWLCLERCFVFIADFRYDKSLSRCIISISFLVSASIFKEIIFCHSNHFLVVSRGLVMIVSGKGVLYYFITLSLLLLFSLFSSVLILIKRLIELPFVYDGCVTHSVYCCNCLSLR